MTKKLFWIAALLLLLLVFSGCGLLKDKMPSEVDFKSGISELEISTLSGTPPKTVYPGTNFKMVVQLDNQAGYEITNGIISLVGLDPYYMEITPSETNFGPFEGRTVTSPSGTRDFKEFDGKVRKGGDSSGYDALFFIKANYFSTIEFSDTVCLNPSIYEIYDGGCAVRGKTSYRGQGAPLAVVAMEEIISPGDGAGAEFRLLLKNKGEGTVEFVTLQKANLGNQELSCEFLNAQADPHTLYINPETEEGVLICKAPLKSLYSYTTTLNAVFAYGYELREPQRITILNPTVR